MKKLLISVLFAFLFSLIFVSPAKAATYYVAGDIGLDTNNGSQSTPWKTIQKAATTMVAGDTVNVKGGIIYSGANACWFGIFPAVVCPINSGTSSAWITYQAWPGTGAPIIDASNAYWGFVMNSSPVINYINIYGFDIRDTGKNLSYIGNEYGIGIYHHVKIINNIISNSPDGGIGSFETINLHDAVIYNNTVNGGGWAGISVSTTDTTDYIENNIVTNASVGIYNSDSPDTVNEDYNLVYGNTSNYSGITQGSHDIFSDPLFVNASGSDFSLQPTSPAINAGTDLTSSGVTTDILGVARPQGPAFDMGAYEYIFPSITTSQSNTSNSTASAPGCNNQEPLGRTTWLYQVIVNSGSQITLKFTNWQTPVDHFTLEYGTKPNQYQYAVDNIGGNGTNTYTVNSLNPNTTYYFRVRTGNGCAVGSWSNEILGRTGKTSSSKFQIINKPQIVNSNTKIKTKTVINQIIPTPTIKPLVTPQPVQQTTKPKFCILWWCF